MLFCGCANPALAQEISSYLGVPLGKIEISHFQDGEVYVRILEPVRKKQVFVIQPTCRPVNENLMELLLIIDALKRASAGEIIAVVPYFGYARQDRTALAREPISAKVVANMIQTAGADRVVTIDLHSDQIQGFFDIPSDHFTAIPTIAIYLLGKQMKKGIVVAADTGGVKRARRLAQTIQFPLAIIDKRRPKPNEAEICNVIGDVKGKTAILFDDMIDTGGTIVAGCHALSESGAKDVYICATHALLSGDAINKLQKAKAKEIIVTNTIPVPKEKQLPNMKFLSMGVLLGEGIRRITAGESVSVLFDAMVRDYLRQAKGTRLDQFKEV
ncbi:ribose-phosphate pyrophosphokinase [Candidatus Woesearchaeota archaeon]|nr:ribose-phosphate pyrophosphokinase [Candidatus Woesearchaeota archaeon]